MNQILKQQVRIESQVMMDVVYHTLLLGNQFQGEQHPQFVDKSHIVWRFSNM